MDGPIGETDSLLTIEDVARRLQVRSNTVRTWSSLGIIPIFHIGSNGERRFRKEDIDSFLVK